MRIVMYEIGLSQTWWARLWRWLAWKVTGKRYRGILSFDAERIKK